MSSTTNQHPEPMDAEPMDAEPMDPELTNPEPMDPANEPVPDGIETIGASTPGQPDGPVKDPQDWVTGDEPMTDSQRSYLDTLAKRAGEQLPADLTKAQASEHIDRLQAMTGLNNPS